MAQINYNDSTKIFARAIEIKDYRGSTYVGLLDILMYVKAKDSLTKG